VFFGFHPRRSKSQKINKKLQNESKYPIARNQTQNLWAILFPTIPKRRKSRVHVPTTVVRTHCIYSKARPKSRVPNRPPLGWVSAKTSIFRFSQPKKNFPGVHLLYTSYEQRFSGFHLLYTSYKQRFSGFHLLYTSYKQRFPLYFVKANVKCAILKRKKDTKLVVAVVVARMREGEFWCPDYIFSLHEIGAANSLWVGFLRNFVFWGGCGWWGGEENYW